MSSEIKGQTYALALQPGYFNWDGLPAKRDVYAQTPQFFNGAVWAEVDEFKFSHEALRVSKDEFDDLLATRLQQHEEFMAEKRENIP